MLESDKQREALKVLEGLIFVEGAPVSFEALYRVLQPDFDLDRQTLRALIEILKETIISQDRAYRLEEIGGGFVFKTCREIAPYVQVLRKEEKPDTLSKSSLEVLAIIASKQPVTRVQIEKIRGVNCSYVLQNLTDRELIFVKGQAKLPGRPSLYEVTPRFFDYFGLKSLNALKRVEEAVSKQIPEQG